MAKTDLDETTGTPTSTVWAVIFVVISTVIVGLYSLRSQRGLAPMSDFVFLALLGVLIFFNLILFIAFWRNRAVLGPRAKVAIILWLGAAFWYWSFAPVYDLFTLNLDNQQLRQLAFEYLWEVPFFGGFYVLVVWLLFLPIAAFIDGKKKSINPSRMYKYVYRYPTIVAVTGFLFTLIGYIVGSLSFGANAFMPVTEQIKNAVNGVMISFFVAVLYYLFFDTLLDPVRVKIEREYNFTNIPKRKFFDKFLVVVFCVVMGSIALFSVLIFHSYQALIKETVFAKMEGRAEQYRQLREQFPFGVASLDDLKVGERAQVFELESWQYLPPDEFSPETLEFVFKNRSGRVQDLKNDIKAVLFWTDPVLNKKIVSVAYMEDFYGEILSVLPKFVLFGTIFILLLALGVVAIFVYLITRPVRVLVAGVTQAATNPSGYQTYIGTADEFEELSRAFEYFIEQTQKSRRDMERLNLSLEGKIKERTRQLREKLLELEQVSAKDEALLSSIGDGMIALDRQGKIIVANEAAAEMLGMDFKKMIGKKFAELISVVDDKGNPISRAKSGKLPFGVVSQKVTTGLTDNYYFTRRDGSRFPVAITSTPMIIEGKPAGAVVTFRDISLEKDIDQAKSEFVSLASHQLRTPLSTINWYTELLLDGDAGKLTPDQEKYLRQIYESNQRMVALVNALLNVSRLELGTFAVEPEPTNIVEIAKSVLDELKPQIAQKKMNIEEKYDPNIPIMQLDPKLIRIVIQNLLTNAIKYTPEKGKVSVTMEISGEKLLLKVADNGYGIPQAQQSQIFTKLFRADNVKQKETEGTGLGLYIVKSIVEQSGGKIWFESAENQGTTFYVTIPISGMAKKEGSKHLD